MGGRRGGLPPAAKHTTPRHTRCGRLGSPCQGRLAAAGLLPGLIPIPAGALTTRRLQAVARNSRSAGLASRTCRSTPQPATLQGAHGARRGSSEPSHGTKQRSAGHRPGSKEHAPHWSNAAPSAWPSLRAGLQEGPWQRVAPPPDRLQGGGFGQEQARQRGAAREVEAPALCEGRRRRIQPCADQWAFPWLLLPPMPGAVVAAAGPTRACASHAGRHACRQWDMLQARAERAAAPSASSCRAPNRLTSSSAGQCSSLADRLRLPQLTARSSRRRLHISTI